MSMFYEAIVKENTKHQNAGGDLAEITFVKAIPDLWLFNTGRPSIVMNCCVDGGGVCVSPALKAYTELTNQ